MKSAIKATSVAVLAAAVAIVTTCCIPGTKVPVSNTKVPWMVSHSLLITVTCKDDERSSGGSGVQLGNTWVVTAKHVVKGAEDCEMTGTTSDGGVIPLKFIRESDKDDVALLQEPASIKTKLVDMIEPSLVGEHAWAVGYPVSAGSGVQHLKITDGVIAGDDTSDTDGEVPTTVVIYYGNSGGGLWNDAGRLLGITVRLSNNTRMAYIVPTSAIVKILNKDVEAVRTKLKVY